MALGRASCEGGRASGWPLEWWVATWAAASQGTLSLLGFGLAQVTGIDERESRRVFERVPQILLLARLTEDLG